MSAGFAMDIYLFKVNNKKTRSMSSSMDLLGHYSSVFTVNFEQVFDHKVFG